MHPQDQPVAGSWKKEDKISLRCECQSFKLVDRVGDPTIGVALQSFPAYGKRRCPPLLSVAGPIHINHQSRKFSTHLSTRQSDRNISQLRSPTYVKMTEKTNQSRSQGSRQGLEGELEQRPWWNTAHWLPLWLIHLLSLYNSGPLA